LGFKRLAVHSIKEGFQFLGYYLRLDAMSEQPRVFIKPSHEAEERFRRKLMSKLALISPKPDWDEAVTCAHEYGRQWRRSFPLWQPSETQLDEFGHFLSGFMSKHALSPPLLACFGGTSN
jgi:hypothetical protein